MNRTQVFIEIRQSKFNNQTQQYDHSLTIKMEEPKMREFMEGLRIIRSVNSRTGVKGFYLYQWTFEGQKEEMFTISCDFFIHNQTHYDMKEYFTQYVSVAGEIKEGSMMKTMGEVMQPFKEGMNKNAYQLYNLFLCSRDIQIGDKFNSANGTDFISSRIDSERVYSIGGLHSELEEVPHNKIHCYKVIGEVSSRAVWVTEGMEFDTSPGMYTGEWQAIPIYKGDQQVTLLGSSRQRRALLSQIPVEKYIILFKCPNCKTFH